MYAYMYLYISISIYIYIHLHVYYAYKDMFTYVYFTYIYTFRSMSTLQDINISRHVVTCRIPKFVSNIPRKISHTTKECCSSRDFVCELGFLLIYGS